MMAIFADSIIPSGTAAFYTPEFNDVLDSHLEYIRKNGNVNSQDIPKSHLGNYKGDFFAVLTGMRIPAQFHRFITKFNGYYSPMDYQGDAVAVLIPDLSLLETLHNVYLTREVKRKF